MFRQISESGKYNALGYKLHVADVSYKSLFLAFKNILADLANALHVAQDLLATIKPETTPQMLYKRVIEESVSLTRVIIKKDVVIASPHFIGGLAEKGSTLGLHSTLVNK